MVTVGGPATALDEAPAGQAAAAPGAAHRHLVVRLIFPQKISDLRFLLHNLLRDSRRGQVTAVKYAGPAGVNPA
jgi:hypothetical protein